MIESLNGKFFSKDNGSIVNEPHSPDHEKPVPFVKFTYDSHTCIVTATSETEVAFTVEGKVFDLIKFDNAYSGITHIFKSTEPVDINAFCADAYISCEQLDDNQYSLHNIPSVLYKVPMDCDYAQYLHHEIK